MDGWNTSFLLGWPIFRGYVSFREGIPDFWIEVLFIWDDQIKTCSTKLIKVQWCNNSLEKYSVYPMERRQGRKSFESTELWPRNLAKEMTSWMMVVSKSGEPVELGNLILLLVIARLQQHHHWDGMTSWRICELISAIFGHFLSTSMVVFSFKKNGRGGKWEHLLIEGRRILGEFYEHTLSCTTN